MDENKSFLIARDPSILSWNRPKIRPSVCVNLRSEFSNSSSLHTMMETEDDNNIEHLEVYLRIKPAENLNELYKIDDNVLNCQVPAGSQALRNFSDETKMKKQYSFTKIYGPEVSQSEIFNDCIKRKVLDFINGKNCTIFTYGTSGSGKTYTILGTVEEPGIIPRSLEYLFRTIPSVKSTPMIKPTQEGEIITLDSSSFKNEIKIRKQILQAFSSTMNRSLHNQTYKLMQQRLSSEPSAILSDSSQVSIGIWVSFAEVYNEYVYDLLQLEPGRGKQRPKLRLGQDLKGNTYIRDLTNVYVSSGLEAYEILQFGMSNLHYSSTNVNSHSSRSHCIFTIKLVQLSSDSKVQISLFNFSDLAGSERAKTTKNVGERLKESNNINTSLHVLGRCIKSIRDSQKNHDSKLIPFRDSKLTRLFQKALLGLESIALVVNINATKEMFDESQHVLNFSAIAKDITIENERKPTKLTVNKRFSRYIQSKGNTAVPNTENSESLENDFLREKVVELSLELEHQRQQWAEKAAEIRRDLVNQFHEKNQKSQEIWMKRMEEQKERLNQIYENSLEQLKKQYEKRLTHQEHNKRLRSSSVVIEIDDSLIEDQIENLNEATYVQEYQEKISNFQKELTQTKFELSSTKTELKASYKKLDEIKTENIKMEQLLKDAEIELKDTEKEKLEIEKQLEERTCEYFNLQKEYSDQVELNSQLCEQLAILKEHVEELEQKLQVNEVIENSISQENQNKFQIISDINESKESNVSQQSEIDEQINLNKDSGRRSH